MKPLVLSLAALTVLTLSACAADTATDRTDSATASTPAVGSGQPRSGSAQEDRFQTLWSSFGELAAEGTLDFDRAPADAAAANDAADLADGRTYVHYADMESRPGNEGGGRWCMESDDDTYLVSTYGDGKAAILMGDGSCTYAPAEALVVGDLMTNEWTRGVDLMGELPLVAQ